MEYNKKTLGKGNTDFSAPFQPDYSSNNKIINERKMINGADDGLMQVHPLKHPYSYEIFNDMMANTWMPQEVEMTKDVEMWNDPNFLTPAERNSYERCLAFISNLDGIQTDNLTTNVVRHLTSPEVRLVIVRQAFEEALHVVSYANMIETLSLDPEKIYGMYRQDMELYEKNAYVLQSLSNISNPNFKTGTLENDQLFLEGCVANVILEGIYFYSAFIFFYVLKRNNKMPGSAEMIQFINRDEDMHLKHFIYMVNTIRTEQPELWTKEFQERLVQNIIGGVELESSWGKSCYGEGILGLNENNLREYLQFVGNNRLKALGLREVWPKAKNPFPWIEEFTQGAMTETNFFEGRVREYASGTLDWDEE